MANALNDLAMAKCLPGCGWETDDESLEAPGAHPDFYGTRADGCYRSPLPQMVDRDQDGINSCEDDIIDIIDAERALDEIDLSEAADETARDRYEMMAEEFGGREAADALELAKTGDLPTETETDDDPDAEEPLSPAGTAKFADSQTREAHHKAAVVNHICLNQSRDCVHLARTRGWKHATKVRKQFLRHCEYLQKKSICPHLQLEAMCIIMSRDEI